MKKHSGFSLIELIITLMVLSALMYIGVPAMDRFMQGNRLVASTNELLSALHVARSEAIKLNKRVSVCESSDGASCNSPGTGNWRKGWIVFVDANGDGQGTGAACTDTNTDCLLRAHEEIADNKLSVSGVYSNGGAIDIFTFTSRGLPKDINGQAQAGTFSLCSFDENNSVINSRAVVLSLTGRVRVSDNTAIINCPAAPS